MCNIVHTSNEICISYTTYLKLQFCKLHIQDYKIELKDYIILYLKRNILKY